MSGRRLGRGLDSLIGRARDAKPPGSAVGEADADHGVEVDENPAEGDLAGSESDGEEALPTPNESAAKAGGGRRKRGARTQARTTPTRAPQSPDGETAPAEPNTAVEGRGQGGVVLQLRPDDIRPNPEQPRKVFTDMELESLSASVKKDGVLQPVLVRQQGDAYELVAGERRWRASKATGQPRIPAIVIDAADDRMLELALIENIQRANLNPIEVARAYKHLIASKGMTQESLASAMGVSRSSVSNMIRLLELPAPIRAAVERSQITLGHAKVLVSIDSPESQRQLFERIAEEKLSVRDLEEEVVADPETPPQKRKRPSPKKKKPPQLLRLEEEFSELLGTRVTIDEGKGRGRVHIEFYSREDFEHLRSVIVAGSKSR